MTLLTSTALAKSQCTQSDSLQAYLNKHSFLGLRQGYIQSKMALVKLLQKYELVLDERTPVPMRIKASSMPCAADGGVWLKLRKLHSSANTN